MRRKIPRSFLLKGNRWKVILKKEIDEDPEFVCNGCCDTDTRTIYLRSDLKGKLLESVFLHELFHAVLFEAHINPGARFSSGLEEVICDAFADVVTSLFTIKLKKEQEKK